eukprot:GEMP01063930.1.p1 GENE.GEMP01063930.1~~GEMP01063930.1.p1  ORF type:complete len:149 (+),score=14.11 GEMP01063930.1:65-448(+)
MFAFLALVVVAHACRHPDRDFFSSHESCAGCCSARFIPAGGGRSQCGSACMRRKCEAHGWRWVHRGEEYYKTHLYECCPDYDDDDYDERRFENCADHVDWLLVATLVYIAIALIIFSALCYYSNKRK